MKRKMEEEKEKEGRKVKLLGRKERRERQGKEGRKEC